MQTVFNGFFNSHEINTVTYDREMIQPQQMINALKQAGTYVGVVLQKTK